MMRVVINTDGGARGTDAHSGCAAIVAFAVDGRVEEHERTRYLGRGTVNEAEYEGLILGLELALEHGATEAVVRMDSKLVVEQVLGAWQIKEARLRPLADRAMELAMKLEGGVRIMHIPREANDLADALCTRLLDHHSGRRRR